MSIEKEIQNQPATMSLETNIPDEEERVGSSEGSLENDWAAAFAEQDQAEAATVAIEPNIASSSTEVQAKAASSTSPQAAVAEEPSATETALEDEWAAALAEQSQREEEAAATTTETSTPASDTDASAKTAAPQTTVAEESPSTEAAMEDEWTAALAEQSLKEADTATTEPNTASSSTEVQAKPASPTSPQAAVAEEPSTTGAALEDEWAAALAEQDQAETAAVTEEPPSAATTLDDEWAAALAEQSQEETATLTIESRTESNDLNAQTEPASFTPTPAPQTNEPPATEAALEDEWAAALAEQSQEEAATATTEPSTVANASDAQTEPASLTLSQAAEMNEPPTTEATLADEHVETQAETHSAATTETSDSDFNSDEDMENDWADVLDEQAQAQQPVPLEIAAEQEMAQKEPEPSTGFPTDDLQTRNPNPSMETKTAPIEGQHAEEAANTDIETGPEGSVKMNWPSDGASQTQADPPAPVPEWKPTRIGEDPEAASPLPEELLAESMASSTAKDPPPELSLAASAAKSSIEAAMESAEDVAAIIQDEQALEEPSQSATEAKDSEDSPSPSEAPTNPAETSETQDLDSAPPDPQPPGPEALAPDSGEAPDRFRRPFFSGTGGSLFGMFTMNTLLTLLTFGVYSFWGRVKIRRYLHSQTRFGGARLAFHGTGGELFKGWMKAMAVFGIPYTALNYAGALQSHAAYQWGVNIVAGLLILCFIPIAIVGSHRYRMSRTTWRGIYFSFRHSAKDFLTLYLKGTLFSILTLGIYYPIFDNAKRAFLSSGTHFGSRAFGFTGEGKELGAIYFKAFRTLILGLVTAEVVLLATSFLLETVNPNQVIDVVFWTTVGIVSMIVPFVLGVWFWFQATRQRYMWSHTTFGSARFQATMTGKDLFELKLTNLFLLVFTLGLAWPWVQTRNLQFLYYHVGLQGPLNLKQVVQDASTASPMGEELAGFFDTGFDLG